MSWVTKTLGIAVLGAVTVVPSMAQHVIGRRAYVVGPRVVVRPYVYSYAPYAYYGPAWRGYWGPGYWGPQYYGYSYPQTGEVKIDTKMKDGSVYVDGGYVGPVKKFKKFWLAPGNHEVSIKDPSGRTIFDQRVNVILDKTVEIRPPA